MLVKPEPGIFPSADKAKALIASDQVRGSRWSPWVLPHKGMIAEGSHGLYKQGKGEEGVSREETRGLPQVMQQWE